MTHNEKRLFKDLSDNNVLGMVCFAFFFGVFVIPKWFVPLLNSLFGV